MKSIDVYSALFTGLKPGTIILTVNQRLCQHLNEEYALYQQNQRNMVWESGGISSFSNWLDEIWQRLSILCDNLPLALNCHQEKALWQNIIQSSEEGKKFLHIIGTVKEAQQAWQTLQQWQVNITEIPHYYTEDIEVFVKWAQTFKKKCEQENWISSCERLSYISRMIDSIELDKLLPKQIIFIGFDEFTPQLENFKTRFTASGRTVNENKLYGKSAQVSVKACQNLENELRHAMSWAASLFKNDAAVNIAIVVPDLENQRDSVERLASEIIDLNIKIGPYAPRYYNIAAAKPLSHYPTITDALSILNLKTLNEFETFSQVLQSSFIKAGQSEQSARAQLDIILRNELHFECKLIDCFHLSKHYELCPLFNQVLETYLNHKLPAKAYLGEWFEQYKILLDTMGWPGERELNSAEYQTVERFYEALDEAASLSYIIGSCSYQKALHVLEQIIDDIVFQPERSPEARISILGMLEASGIPFDAMWVIGMNEDKWPAPARPNPFIPLAMQVKLDMPHASAAREFYYAKRLMDDLNRHSDVLLFSYSCWQDDIALNSSPLLMGYSAEVLPAIKPYSHLKFNTGKDLEYLVDDYGISLNEFESVKAGSGLFKDQALCPFKAYASWRLKVEAFPELTEIMDASIQGNMVHGILQDIWTELKDSSRLNVLTEAQLNQVVSQAVNKTVQQYKKQHKHLFNEALSALETTRLIDLMLAWLEYEKQRSEFKVVSIEQSTLSEMGGIPLHLRIDRVDELPGGEKIIIDYKTGKAGINEWRSDRMISPQLPLYAVVKHAQGIAFAKVNETTDRGFEGLGQSEGLVPGMKVSSDWNRQLEEWKNQLLHLAEECKLAYAAVKPKSISAACMQCKFDRLCRVDYQTVEQLNAVESDSEEGQDD